MPDAKLLQIENNSPAVSSYRSPKPAARKLGIIVFAILSAILLVSLLYHPDDAPAQTICAFKTFVGLPCPACGMTRSFCAAAKAEPSRAFAFNLLGPPLFIIAIAVWGLSLSACLNRPAAFSYVLGLIGNPRFIKPALSILFAYWGARVIYVLVNDGFAASVGQGLLCRILQ